LLAIVLQTAALYADAVGNSFPFMHCCNIMKDHPKWMEVRPTQTSCMPCDDIFPVDEAVDFNTADAFAEPSEAATSTRKRPMAAKSMKVLHKALSGLLGTYS
jgi:hypothetical protein